MLGFVLAFVPGIVFMVKYSLYAPVVLMEGWRSAPRSNAPTSFRAARAAR